MGYFDGIHIGHKCLIDAMDKYAVQNNLDKAVFTFTKSITLGHKGKDILNSKDKLEAIENLGVDLFYSPDFSVFSQLTPEEFVKDVLTNSMGAKAVFCGENFLFGKNRTGTIRVLKELCLQYGIEAFVVPTVTIDDEIVSSSLVRVALADGNMEKTNLLLGRCYSINFEVVHGKSLGKTLGTPTINQIYPEGMCTPKEGVYITKTTVESKEYPSVTGFGSRPTVSGTDLSCETFIKGFSGDLYGQCVRVEFLKYLFPTQKFSDVAKLREMILSAADEASDYLAKNK